jgi:hypothetical protein
MTFGFDTMLNYQLSKKLKLIGINKFNYLIISLTNKMKRIRSIYLDMTYFYCST